VRKIKAHGPYIFALFFLIASYLISAGSGFPDLFW